MSAEDDNIESYSFVAYRKAAAHLLIKGVTEDNYHSFCRFLVAIWNGHLHRIESVQKHLNTVWRRFLR